MGLKLRKLQTCKKLINGATTAPTNENCIFSNTENLTLIHRQRMLCTWQYILNKSRVSLLSMAETIGRIFRLRAAKWMQQDTTPWLTTRQQCCKLVMFWRRLSVSVCVRLCFRTKSRKLLVGNWCNLVGICAMGNARSGWKLMTFDLDLWPWVLFSYFSNWDYTFLMALLSNVIQSFTTIFSLQLWFLALLSLLLLLGLGGIYADCCDPMNA